ncbi:MAG: cell division protein FtsA [Pseudomonadota bacterium]
MSTLSQRLLIRDRAAGKTPLVAALDIGSSKIGCLISRRADMSDGVIKIAGAGDQSSRGVVSGAVVDMDGLERSIRLAVEQAESAAGVRVSDVVVGVSGPDLKGEATSFDLSVSGREISETHVREALAGAVQKFKASGREVLHAAPMGYAVDGSAGVRDPRGMFADVLTASVLIVSVPGPALKNIAQCVTRAHLTPAAFVASPYASALAALVEDEREQGAVVVDMGGGVTSATAFHQDGAVYLSALPIGGARVSNDLSQGVGTTLSAAERLKTLHGAATLTEVDAFDMVDAPRLGDDGRLEASRLSKGQLAGMIRPRVEEIFELVDARLSKASATGRPLPRRIVLTGGGSLLPGVKDVAEDVFRAPVRLARPAKTIGLGERYETAAFTAAAGLLRWEMAGPPDANGAGFARHAKSLETAGLLRKTFAWLRDNV